MPERCLLRAGRCRLCVKWCRSGAACVVTTEMVTAETVAMETVAMETVATKTGMCRVSHPQGNI
ncbi:hypothetical protein GCM10023083_26970 [Streptomyces phyllanthi]